MVRINRSCQFRDKNTKVMSTNISIKCMSVNGRLGKFFTSSAKWLSIKRYRFATQPCYYDYRLDTIPGGTYIYKHFITYLNSETTNFVL